VREQLIVAHIQLVRYVAQRMLGNLHSTVELQDLVSYGMFGLMDAIERYDPAREVKFSTFATYRIQGAINDEMRSQAWEPRSVRAMHRKMLAAGSHLEHELGRAPTEEEVATHVGITVAELRRTAQEVASSRVMSVDGVGNHVRGEGVLGLADLLSSREQDDLGMLNSQVSQVLLMLTAALDRLPSNERVLLQLIYVQQMMLKDIARVLRVTDSWVSHLHTRAMVSLQRAMSAQF
jgi:RNA polymerase sigma factor for flagellar operon FliA